MTRAKRETSEATQEVKVGDVDPMSAMARCYNVPLCGRSPKGFYAPGTSCTRAAGHDETIQRHPGTHHIFAPGPDHVVKKVWS